MYTLRILSAKGVTYNINLGNNYHVIHRDIAPEEFELAFKETELEKLKHTIMVIVGEGGRFHALSTKERAWIVGDTGKTFEKLLLLPHSDGRVNKFITHVKGSVIKQDKKKYKCIVADKQTAVYAEIIQDDKHGKVLDCEKTIVVDLLISNDTQYNFV